MFEQQDQALISCDVWKICNKIRLSVLRSGINLWEFFLPLDPNKNNLISEANFVKVLNGKFKEAFGLSEREISELTDYFRITDGRIYYTQLCEVVHDQLPKERIQNYEEAFRVNNLSVPEERRLLLLLTKIAELVNLRKLIIRPYFQDYELISKITGAVTVSHFARVLSYLGIMVSPDDFHLILKKFMRDSYCVNYVAFIAYIDQIVKHLDCKLFMDLGGDVLSQWPGRATSADLPKLPRPEIVPIQTKSIFEIQTKYLPTLKPQVERDALEKIIRRIQQHVFTNRLCTVDFFKDFDPMGSGRVTASQFLRSLNMMSLAGIHRLWLSDLEFQQLICMYKDPSDPDRVCYTVFKDDIDKVFTCCEMRPETAPPVMVTPLPEILEYPRGEEWKDMRPEPRDLCEEVLEVIKRKAVLRRIRLIPVFNDYDKNNNGHVTRPQFRQCLLANGFLLSEEELLALENKYTDDMGFNYFWFLREAEPKEFDEPLYKPWVRKQPEVKSPPLIIQNKETDIVEILAKIKGQLGQERIRVSDIMRDFDRYNQNVVSKENFAMALDMCRFNLTPLEINTLVDVFASPLHKQCVEYRKFCERVEEAMTQPCIGKAPFITALDHCPNNICDRNFLNFEERHYVGMALEKIATEQDMNLIVLFQELDPCNTGIITKEQFVKVLSSKGLAEILSGRELEVLLKCYGFERDWKDQIDYRAFCRSLELLFVTAYKKPC